MGYSPRVRQVGHDWVTNIFTFTGIENLNIYVKSYNFDFKISLQIRGGANRVYEEQDAGQILQGTAGNFETLTASGVLSLEASSADSQVSSPFACKFLPALKGLSRD